MDLESSIEDGASLKAVKSRRSESNLSGSELDGTYPSSGEDILSSKDSLDSIPSTQVRPFFLSVRLFAKAKLTTCFHFMWQSEQSRTNLKQPPSSPAARQKPQRELFEGWAEYTDNGTGRPFYYNRETRAKSWKPPRRRGPSPMIRVT